MTYTDRRWRWNVQAVIKLGLRPRRGVCRAWVPGPTMEGSARTVMGWRHRTIMWCSASYYNNMAQRSIALYQDVISNKLRH